MIVYLFENQKYGSQAELATYFSLSNKLAESLRTFAK
jgi:hypothetical protein